MADANWVCPYCWAVIGKPHLSQEAAQKGLEQHVSTRHPLKASKKKGPGVHFGNKSTAGQGKKQIRSKNLISASRPQIREAGASKGKVRSPEAPLLSRESDYESQTWARGSLRQSPSKIGRDGFPRYGKSIISKRAMAT